MSADSVGLMRLLNPYSFAIYLLKKMNQIFLDSGFSCLYPFGYNKIFISYYKFLCLLL